MLKIFLTSFLIIFLFSNTALSNFIIKEIFPNTINDSELEYIVIENTSNKEMNLKWYSISDKSWKKYVFKEFNFTWNSNKKYYRSETKILLNNSKEELYLKNIEWNVVDSFIYDSTEKWYVYFKNWENIDYKIISVYDDWKSEESEINQETKLNKLIYTFQNPTYLLEKNYDINSFWTWWIIYNCDKNYSECKVNLDLRNNFNWEFNEKDFLCNISFWSWIVTWEENKCNPSTVLFPIWEFDIKFEIINKKDKSYYIENNIVLINKEEEIEEKKVFKLNIKNELYIPKPKIIIQSWLEESYSKVYRNYYTCNKKECSINLDYKWLDSWVDCKWKFYDGIHSDWTEKKCNPWYVKYWPWLHKIKLFVCDENYSNNCNKNYIYVENKYIPEKLIAKINLQWILWKNKMKIWNNLYCINSEKCSINFTWDNSKWEIVKYLWDFWNWEKYEWKNPSNRTFQEWTYEILLSISDEEWNKNTEKYSLNVLDKKLSKNEVEKIILDNKNIFSLDKNKILLNNFFSNDFKNHNNKLLLDLINSFSQTIRENKNSTTIYWKTKPNLLLLFEINKEVPILWSIKKDKYFIKSNNEWKYSLNIENSKIWKYKISSFIINENLWTLDLNSKKYFEVNHIKNKLNTNLNKDINKNKLLDLPIKLIINIQWKIWKNKIINWNNITCIWTCSINFDASDSKWNINKFLWDFWNGEEYSWVNPWYIKYKDYWSYILKLTWYDYQWNIHNKNYYITFIPEIKKSKTKIKKIELQEEIKFKKLENIDETNNIYSNEKVMNKYLTIIIFILLIIFWIILLKREKII